MSPRNVARTKPNGSKTRKFTISEDQEQIKTLMRAVVAELGPKSLDAPQTKAPILDLEIDGVRCLLTRATLPHSTPDLTPREQEITRMVAKGYPNKTIAGVLEISTWTVSTHLRRIFAKMAVGSRAALVAKFLEKYTL
jgi:DNA-binding CsgD family transcriptional regulator